MSTFDPNRWTQKTQEAFNDAVSRARAANNPEVTPDHLLAALLSQEATVVLPVLHKVAQAPLSVRNRVEEALSKPPQAYGPEAQTGRAFLDLLAALLSREATVVLPVLQKVGQAPLSVRDRVEESLSKLAKAYGSEAQMGRAFRDVLSAADEQRIELGDEYLSVEQLLLALADK